MRIITLLMLSLLSACSSVEEAGQPCGIVAGYLEPDSERSLYRSVVTHIDGKPVISKPNYLLAPGVYQFTLAELIDAPTLKVKLAARGSKDIKVHVKANQRYHLAAKFYTDKIYRGLDSEYWQPVISLIESHECQLPIL